MILRARCRQSGLFFQVSCRPFFFFTGGFHPLFFCSFTLFLPSSLSFLPFCVEEGEERRKKEREREKKKRGAGVLSPPLTLLLESRPFLPEGSRHKVSIFSPPLPSPVLFSLLLLLLPTHVILIFFRGSRNQLFFHFLIFLLPQNKQTKKIN